jgi:hypothetical protein
MPTVKDLLPADDQSCTVVENGDHQHADQGQIRQRNESPLFRVLDVHGFAANTQESEIQPREYDDVDRDRPPRTSEEPCQPHEPGTHSDGVQENESAEPDRAAQDQVRTCCFIRCQP